MNKGKEWILSKDPDREPPTNPFTETSFLEFLSFITGRDSSLDGTVRGNAKERSMSRAALPKLNALLVLKRYFEGVRCALFAHPQS